MRFPWQAMNNSTVALSMLNAEINKQAATIGYINDFAIMMWVVIITIPMVCLLRNPVRRKDDELPAMMAE